MRRWLIALIFAPLSLISCGGSPVEDPQPNFFGNGYSLRIEQTSQNTYRFTVIQNSSYPNTVFTVYGFHDETQINSTFPASSHARLSHVQDASQPGSEFEVTFNNDDTWFAIYQDDWDGIAWIYSDRQEFVRGQFR